MAVADVDVARAAQTAADLGSTAMAVECDVSDGAAVERAVAAALDRFGRIDAVHNNAGISTPSKPLDETTEAEWDRLMTVNLKSLLWTTRAALPARSEAEERFSIRLVWWVPSARPTMRLIRQLRGR